MNNPTSRSEKMSIGDVARGAASFLGEPLGTVGHLGGEVFRAYIRVGGGVARFVPRWPLATLVFTAQVVPGIFRDGMGAVRGSRLPGIDLSKLRWPPPSTTATTVRKGVLSNFKPGGVPDGEEAVHGMHEEHPPNDLGD